ncbi:hypothetical protein BASA81_002198 [Batrachochytrium salamandrivorans]|nr:hypothetical protein BASA81_002198 [Batrachochytrium salamandrivorans]
MRAPAPLNRTPQPMTMQWLLLLVALCCQTRAMGPLSSSGMLKSEAHESLNLRDYSIPESTIQAWTTFAKELAQARSEFKNNQTKYNEFCAQRKIWQRPKYRFPRKRNLSSSSYEELLDNAIRTQWALANHYQFTSIAQAQNSAFASMGLDRVANKFYQALASNKKSKLVWGFMGTSVMSGQDNCYDVTLAPLLARKLQTILGLEVEVRNQGQNGDSPDQTMQLLCAQSTLGVNDVDFLHVWYPMMPQAQFAFKDFFLRNWYLNPQSKLAQVTMFDDSAFGGLEEFESAGLLTKINWNPDYQQRFVSVWPPSEAWGQIGDGFCHDKTREGIPAVMKQNWHYGPMGFEQLSDGLLMFYNAALIQALQLLIKKQVFNPIDEIKVPTKWSSVLQRECTNTCGHRQCFSAHQTESSEFAFACENLLRYKPIVCATGNGPQFQPGNDLFRDWNGRTVKATDTSTPWLTQEKYAQRGECSAFRDEGFAFKASKVTDLTDWLEFEYPSSALVLPETAVVNVMVCHGQRGLLPFATSLGSEWQVNLRVFRANGSLVYEHTTRNLTTASHVAMRPCIVLVQGRDRLALPGFRSGIKLAVQFAYAGSSQQDLLPKEIVIGNLFFF